MRFSIALNDFQKLLQKVMPAVPSKSTLPILEHFLLRVSDGEISITATDLELTIIAAMQVETESSGAALVPARKLTEIIKALAGAEGSVAFSCDENYDISLATSFGQYSMKGMSDAEYPHIPELHGEDEAFLTAANIMRIANKTSFAVSNDEYKPAMNGVFLHFNGTNVKAAATDGFRLSQVIIKSESGEQLYPEQLKVIIPARMAELLRKVDSDVKVTVSKTHAQFVMNDTTILTRLINETFPQYENVIPTDNDKMMIVNNRDLLAAIKRVSLFANTASRQIRFSIKPTLLTVSTEDIGNGNHASEDVRCEFNQEEFEIGFNYKYVEEALQNMDVSDTNTESVFLFSLASRASLLKNHLDDDALLMLVMPVRY